MPISPKAPGRSCARCACPAPQPIWWCFTPAHWTRQRWRRWPAQGARLVETDRLPTSVAFDAAHGRAALHGAAPFTKGEKPAFHTPLDNFAKLRLWQLDYDRVVFLDADTLVLRNIDTLFDYPEFCAAPNVYQSLADFHRMNSGVFTARPDPATFDSMLTRLDRPGAFWRRTDQTFLQDFSPIGTACR
jgi:alpha-N-acetylglucosamine transferase